ncbi:MAG TPA: hypothetical protein VHB98_21995 [Chloroflexota bacterium]|nr:hypothetical protein [Chloroflexota bacterium]
MSRKGQLWRGDLAQHIEDYLAGVVDAGELMEWALDHPFFDDQAGLDDEDRLALGEALGSILQLSEAEPAASRTTGEQLEAVVRRLWGRPSSS